MENTTKKVRIIELRKKGFTINEIVKELKCAKSTVSYHINNCGLGGIRNAFLNGISDEIIEKIKQYRIELKTYDEIRSLVDVGKDKLIKICRLLEINNSSGTFKKIVLNKDEVVKYYLGVNSLRKTSKFFNVSRAIIRKYIPDEIVKLNDLNKVLKTKSQSVIDWRKRKKIELVKYKGGKCECCGYDKSVSVLQFHHLDLKEKDFTIGGSSYGFERLKKEVDKCIMVCANCHIEIHDEIREFGYSEKIKNIKLGQ